MCLDFCRSGHIFRSMFDKSAAMEAAQGLEPPSPGLSILVSSLIDCVVLGHSHSLSEMNFSLLARIIISIVFLELGQSLSIAVAYSPCRIRALWLWQKWCSENSEAGLYKVTHLPPGGQGAFDFGIQPAGCEEAWADSGPMEPLVFHWVRLLRPRHSSFWLLSRPQSAQWKLQASGADISMVLCTKILTHRNV